MRPILIPLAGVTDAKGNATIVIPLERTGDWRNVKISLGTTAPAEWAIVQSGTEVTYGRGRRVTLGPELLEPYDTLIAQITGGPILAAIAGSCKGIGGTMDEVLPYYNPAPNTIALDVGGNPAFVGQVPIVAGAGAATFQIPPLTQAVQAIVTTSNAASTITVTGAASGKTYINARPLGAGTTTVVAGGFDPADYADSPAGITVTLAGGTVTQNVPVFVVAPGITPMNSRSLPLWVTQAGANPALWQAPSSGVTIDVSAPAGNTPLVTGIAGQTVRIFGFAMTTDAGGTIQMQDTNGNEWASIAKTTTYGVNLGGLPLLAGTGIRIHNPNAGNVACNGTLSYSQG